MLRQAAAIAIWALLYSPAGAEKRPAAAEKPSAEAEKPSADTGKPPAEAPKPPTVWRVVFSSIEVERQTAFASTGFKLGQPVTADTAATLQFSHGYSLGDADRARRSGWTMQHVEQQSRVFIGFERSAGAFHVSAGIGLSRATTLVTRQFDPVAFAILLADATGVERRLIPRLLQEFPPHTWLNLLPPRIETHIGAALDISLWWRPQADRYSHVVVVADQAARSVFARARLGWKPDPLPFAFGPELSVSGGTNWEKLRAGLHIGDLRIGRFGFEASGGWMTTETRKTTPYATFALYAKF